MRVLLGSANPIKLAALIDVLDKREDYRGWKVAGAPIASGVAEQPLSLEETIEGAENRAWAARDALMGSDWGVGIESGVVRTAGIALDVCACVIVTKQSGKADRYLGLSSAWEVPARIAKRLRPGFTIDDAFRVEGLTTAERIGRAGGAVSICSGGRFTRRAQTKQAIESALMRLENPNAYLRSLVVA